MTGRSLRWLCAPMETGLGFAGEEVHVSAVAPAQGDGRRLRIVHELVGLYGGRVTLGAASSGGLTVALELPAG